MSTPSEEHPAPVGIPELAQRLFSHDAPDRQSAINHHFSTEVVYTAPWARTSGIANVKKLSQLYADLNAFEPEIRAIEWDDQTSRATIKTLSRIRPRVPSIIPGVTSYFPVHFTTVLHFGSTKGSDLALPDDPDILVTRVEEHGPLGILERLAKLPIIGFFYHIILPVLTWFLLVVSTLVHALEGRLEKAAGKAPQAQAQARKAYDPVNEGLQSAYRVANGVASLPGKVLSEGRRNASELYEKGIDYTYQTMERYIPSPKKSAAGKSNGKDDALLNEPVPMRTQAGAAPSKAANHSVHTAEEDAQNPRGASADASEPATSSDADFPKLDGTSSHVEEGRSFAEAIAGDRAGSNAPSAKVKLDRDEFPTPLEADGTPQPDARIEEGRSYADAANGE